MTFARDQLRIRASCRFSTGKESVEPISMLLPKSAPLSEREGTKPGAGCIPASKRAVSFAFGGCA